MRGQIELDFSLDASSEEEIVKTAMVMKDNSCFVHTCVDVNELDALIDNGVQPSRLSLLDEKAPITVGWIHECGLLFEPIGVIEANGSFLRSN